MSETTLVFRSRIPAPADALRAWHANPGAFERLTPPWMDVRVLASAGTTDPGDWKRLRVPVAGPLSFSWTIVHDELDGPGFLDIQQDGPFRFWRHEHRFLPDGPGHSVLEDRITYQLPYGAIGETLAGGRIEQQLATLFRFRHRQTQLNLGHHTRAGLPPLRIGVTGASGLVGSRLVPFLRAGGHEVVRFVRHRPRHADEIFWNPTSGDIDAAALEGMDAVVHLAGVSLADGRWTRSRKAAIRDSRIHGTWLLARTLADLQRPPRVLVSTSAVGYYGDRGHTMLTEQSPGGEGFLAGVCDAWETAAAPASAAGIRVVHPRFGVVLASNGGFLAKLLPLFRLGMGGQVGTGEQFMSWIALDELLGVILESIANERLAGPVNAVAPSAVTNREFTAVLGRMVNRPAIARVPAPLLRLGAGQVADELILASQRAQPARLEHEGFPFAFPTIEDALRHELGRSPAHPDAEPAIAPDGAVIG